MQLTQKNYANMVKILKKAQKLIANKKLIFVCNAIDQSYPDELKYLYEKKVLLNWICDQLGKYQTVSGWLDKQGIADTFHYNPKMIQYRVDWINHMISILES